MHLLYNRLTAALVNILDGHMGDMLDSVVHSSTLLLPCSSTVSQLCLTAGLHVHHLTICVRYTLFFAALPTQQHAVCACKCLV